MKKEEPIRPLSYDLEKNIRDANPWWRQERVFGVPLMKRWAFEPILHRVKNGLAPAVLFRGPRQVGKTTLLLQVIHTLLDEGISPQRIFRIQFDALEDLIKKTRSKEPILHLIHWYSEIILEKSLNQSAVDNEQAFIFLDEVQNLPNWAPQLKYLVDIYKVRALVTGSSALRIAIGKDSLAGRVQSIEMGPLFLREIAELRGFGKLQPFLSYNGLAPLKKKEFWMELKAFGQEHKSIREKTFEAFSQRGAYPVCHVGSDRPWEEVADQLNETVIKRAIQHDLRMGERGQRRDEHLLEEVFRLACRYIGQTPAKTLYANELKSVMDANVGWQRVLTYLKFLDGTLLLRLIEPLELRLKKQRGAPKLTLCDHALRAAWLQEVIPLTESQLMESSHLIDLAGRVAESVVGYFFKSIVGLDVAYFPEREAEPEVDFILTIGEQRIPVEIKYRRNIDHKDTYGLRSFLEKAHYNAPFGILVTLTEDCHVDDPRIVCIPLSMLLMMR